MSFPRWFSPYMLPLATAVLIWCAYPGGGELYPLLVVALLPLLIFLSWCSTRQAFWAGMLTGLLQYLLLLYWITTVLGKYGGLPMAVTVPALLLLAGYMALYTGCFAILARSLICRGAAVLALIGVPALWVGLDWLRGTLFTGFPWMDLGYGLAGNPALIQAADLFGHSGLTFLVVLVNTCLVLLFRQQRSAGSSAVAVMVTVSLLGGIVFYSQKRWREVEAELTAPEAGTATVGIVQGNIDQSLKWSPDNQLRTLKGYLAVSSTLIKSKAPELLIWPETALPFYPETYGHFQLVPEMLAGSGTAVLTGAPKFEIVDRASRDIRYYNSALLIIPDELVGEEYFKSHLVPFGEYVPLKTLLPFLAPLVEAAGDFTPGKVGKPLEWQSSQLGVLICFESIFPDIARNWVENGANVLVNLTNDAWYGKSSAPYHSMAMTVLRSVETRRSVIRSANTGISGFIDPLGRAEVRSPLFEDWSRVAEVALMSEKTVFVRWGFWFAPACLVVGALIAAASQRRTV